MKPSKLHIISGNYWEESLMQLTLISLTSSSGSELRAFPVWFISASNSQPPHPTLRQRDASMFTPSCEVRTVVISFLFSYILIRGGWISHGRGKFATLNLNNWHGSPHGYRRRRQHTVAWLRPAGDNGNLYFTSNLSSDSGRINLKWWRDDVVGRRQRVTNECQRLTDVLCNASQLSGCYSY